MEKTIEQAEKDFLAAADKWKKELDKLTMKCFEENRFGWSDEVMKRLKETPEYKELMGKLKADDCGH